MTFEQSGPRGHYRIFGLSVASDIPLPEATPAALPPGTEPDVVVEVGQVPGELALGKRLAPWIAVEASRLCLLTFEGLGRILVGKDRIVVEKHPDATYDDLRGFMLGSAFGAMLHQRGLVPLHVSALETPDGVVAFTGESGAGKSTLAAVLNKEMGWPLVSDDVAVAHVSGNRIFLQSGVNTVKLWRDALDMLNQPSEGLRRDLTRFNKFHAVRSEKFTKADEQLPLSCLFRLEWGSVVEAIRLPPRQAFATALGTVYRPLFATLFSNRTNVAQVGTKLASSVRIMSLARPKTNTLAPEVMRHIMKVIAES